MSERKPKAKTAFKTPKKAPRRPTPERLANIALHHLERFATSAENLRRVLERRVIKAAHHHEDLDIDEARGWIDDLIQRYVASGLLNDQAYADAKVRSLTGRGNASRLVRMKLKEKGLDEAVIDQALEALSVDHADPELAAAVRLAKRRRLGPFADPAKRAELRDKHLAALARAGFSYDLARKVIEAEFTDELEDLIAPPPFTGLGQ